MRRICILLGVLLLIGASIGGARGGSLSSRITPEQTPKPHTDSWVSDPYEQLTAATRAKVNAIADKLEKDLTDELAIVVIKRMQSSWDIESFARKLIDLWGIGKAGKNNGILILVATEDREMRIQTGKGARKRLTDSRAERIIQNFMIPKLKEGDLNEAVRVGVIVADDVLRGQKNYVNETKEMFILALLFLGFCGIILMCVQRDRRREARRKQYEESLRRLQSLGNQNTRAEGSCCICLDQLPDAAEAADSDNPPVLTTCNHPFHFKCLNEWLARSDTCPVCRRSHPCETGADQPSSSDQAAPQPAPRPQGWRSWFTRRRPSTGYSYRPYHFRPFYRNSWGGYCGSDLDRFIFIQQQRFPDVQRDFNVTGAGANLQYTRVTPPAATSKSSGRSFGGGSSRGGGGSSGRW